MQNVKNLYCISTYKYIYVANTAVSEFLFKISNNPKFHYKL